MVECDSKGERGRSMLLGILAILAVILAVGAWRMTPPPADPRVRSERLHGILLPPSASGIQCRGDAWHWAPDRGETTLFEMKSADLAGFVGRLKVSSRNTPARTGPGDPTLNGWNVWPNTARSFVPGNRQYGGFSRTWTGDAVPVEMLSCASPTGDWLHVEYWKLAGDSLLVKMHTSWN